MIHRIKLWLTIIKHYRHPPSYLPPQKTKPLLLRLQRVFIRIIRKLSNKSLRLLRKVWRMLKILAYSHSYRLVGSIENLDCELSILDQRPSCKQKPPLDANFPKITIAYLKNVKLLGLIDGIFTQSLLFHYELSQINLALHDLKTPTLLIPYKHNSKQYYIKDMVKTSPTIHYGDDMLCISLLKEHSPNYYHWTTEVLPKLVLILKTLQAHPQKPTKKTLLLDESLPKQCIEGIERLTNGSFLLAFVHPGQAVACKNLLYCAPLWLSLDNTKHAPETPSEFAPNPYALSLVRAALLQNNSPLPPKRRIYLTRSNTRLRPITNIGALETLMRALNFEFINTENLTLSEQLSLFSDISLLVGASGAAFTNLIFMQENTQAVILFPSTKSANHAIFQPLADVAKVNLTYHPTIPEEPNQPLHSPASVNIKTLEKLIGMLDD
jgi:hypothetical protein